MKVPRVVRHDRPDDVLQTGRRDAVPDEPLESVDDEPLRDARRDSGALFEHLAPIYATRTGRQYPAINIYDAIDHFLLTAELPGLTAADFELSMTGDAVTLRGVRERDRHVRDEAYRRQERLYGTWSRTVSLPGKVDADRVTASLTQGILTVVVPKVEELRPRPISVTMVGS